MRAPSYSNVFAVFVGTGSQIYVIWSLILTYQWLNMLSHLDARPYIWYFLIFSLASTGAINGYMMAKTMRMFGQSTNWKEMSCVSACLLPLFTVIAIFFIDILEYVEQAEEEIDISTSLWGFALWTFICIPCTFLGASFGMVGIGGSESVQKVNPIPRPIPYEKQPFYLNTFFVCIISGLTTFASFYVVFSYLWRSVWRSEAHIMLMYVWVFSIITSIVISELSIIFTFLRLRSGDYKWQWKSFWIGASSSAFVFGGMIYYMMNHLALRMITDDIVYLLWTGLFIVPYFFFSGSTSVVASGLFVNLIYKK